MGNTLGAYGYLLWGVKYDIPFVQSIQSILPIVEDFVVLTDPRFKDGTLEILETMSTENPKLRVIQYELDLNDPGIDGKSKAFARHFTNGDILVQIDFDEVFREIDLPKIQHLVQNWNPDEVMLGTGVVNWFNGEHFKMSSAGWRKERFSVNTGNITHGIPKRHRISSGEYYYARAGTDGAGYIYTTVGQSVECDRYLCDVDKFPKDYEDPKSIWIHHYSWYSLPRKWKMKPTWHYFWGILYNKYKCLDDYTVDLDGEPVDFWYPEKSWNPMDSYISGITDEMKEKSIVRNSAGLLHSENMISWLRRQPVYIPPKLHGLIPEKRINM